MIEVLPQSEGNMLVVKATKKLTNQDYKDVMIPRLEAIIREYGRARFILDLSHDFHGWEASAMWDDVRFGVAHRNSFERMAIVGGPKCAEWGTKLAKLIMNGEIRYFPPEKYDEAYEWVSEYSTAETDVTMDHTEYEPELVESNTGN
ncbi:MAG: STAS/SEC14 domain-containing protein [Pirellulales bacterium]|nr:STAS/SEC14 domain-containing protein [Pirellulales bacterium]